jgi:serine/threonine-protein kinase PknK
MTTLKGIKGDQIRYLDEDPVVQGIAGGSWSSGGALNNSRSEQQGTFGLQDAAIVVGQGNITESYNGTSWTEVNDLNTPRSRGTAVGIQTAGIAFGGVGDPTTPFPDATVAINESWNGTSWTEVGDLPVAKADYAGLGTQTAALSIMGSRGTPTTTVESWDGSAWTLGTATNSGRTNQAASGIQTAGLTYGGNNPGPTLRAFTESWNGTSWTEVGDLNTARVSLSGAGPNTAALAFAGGTPPATGATESWDGTSWTEVNDLATARGAYQSGAGTGNTSALLAGAGTYTEEWTTAPTNSLALQEGMLWFNSTSQTLKGYGTAAGLPAGTWASAANLNAARYSGATAGFTADAALFIGGTAPPAPTHVALTESYNGTSWTEVSDLNTARSYTARAGSQTSAVLFAGTTGTVSSAVELWNGTSWTANPTNYPAAYYSLSATGTQTASIIAGGGFPDSAVANTFDGSSFTAITSINTARRGSGMAGTQTSAILWGGEAPQKAINEFWDGTSWTEVGDYPSTVQDVASWGTSSSSATGAGGYTTTYASLSATWNGTSWATTGSLPQGVSNYCGGAGAGASSGLVAGGSAAGAITASYEFSATAAVSTITTS